MDLILLIFPNTTGVEFGSVASRVITGYFASDIQSLALLQLQREREGGREGWGERGRDREREGGGERGRERERERKGGGGERVRERGKEGERGERETHASTQSGDTRKTLFFSALSLTVGLPSLNTT